MSFSTPVLENVRHRLAIECSVHIIKSKVKILSTAQRLRAQHRQRDYSDNR